VVEAQDDFIQFLRTLVVQRNRFGAGDCLRARIELRLDRVVGLQLPVIRTRPSAPVARARVVGAADRIGQRHVTADGTRRRQCRRRGLLSLQDAGTQKK
jgi:hypothetical protein